MKLNDNQLARAFEEAEKREMTSLPSDEVISFTPSTDFENKMSKLIRGERKHRFNNVGISTRRIACVALVALTMFGTAMSVKAIRKPIVRFLVETNEKFTRMLFKGQDEVVMPQTIETVYTLSGSASLAGYELTSEITETLAHFEAYKDSNGNIISLNQSVLAATYITMDSGNMFIEDVSIQSNSGKYHKNESTVNLIWSDGGYVFEITAPSGTESEDLINMAKNLKTK